MAYAAGPFDRNQLYLQWGGSLPGGEQWVCGLRMATTEGFQVGNHIYTRGEIQEGLDESITPAVVAYHSNPLTSISSSAKLQYVKLNFLGTDGKYVNDFTQQNIVADVQGNGVGSRHPNQIATVVTLETGFKRGPAHQGRYYLPAPACNLDAENVAPEDWALQVAIQSKTFIEALSDWTGLDTADTPGVVVMSRKAGAPATHRVTGVKVGRVLDTQRRRRSAMLERYQERSVDQGLF